MAVLRPLLSESFLAQLFDRRRGIVVQWDDHMYKLYGASRKGGENHDENVFTIMYIYISRQIMGISFRLNTKIQIHT